MPGKVHSLSLSQSSRGLCRLVSSECVAVMKSSTGLHKTWKMDSPYYMCTTDLLCTLGGGAKSWSFLGASKGTNHFQDDDTC